MNVKDVTVSQLMCAQIKSQIKIIISTKNLKGIKDD